MYTMLTKYPISDEGMDDRATARAVTVLLNCYCREVAGPAGELAVDPRFGRADWPRSVRTRLYRAHVLEVRMPHVGARLVVGIRLPSRSGNYRYQGSAYGKLPGCAWAPLSWSMLASLIIRELSLKYDQPFNQDLLAQISDSVAVTRRLLASVGGESPADGVPSFRISEQAMRYGHPFHPAPKSRLGFDADDIVNYSPECGAEFGLHYFSVRRDKLVEHAVSGVGCQAVITDQAPLRAPSGHALVPVHPWQARYLLSLSSVRRALADGVLIDHGACGDPWWPTSSIRTLYRNGSDYFYKFSLQVRITNCVRKNATYELDGALAVTRLMRERLPALQRRFPGLRVMDEPAYQTVDLGCADPVARTAVREGFGLILRRGIDQQQEPHIAPLLAGALFGNGGTGERWVDGLIGEHALHAGLDDHDARLSWFDAYVGQSLPPVLYCYFIHGMVFEPHLQNVVIGVRDGLPVRLYLRDFEGVKLRGDRYDDAALDGLAQRTRDGLRYSAEKGWKRISYCLFINNYCEAIAQLAEADPAREMDLWRVVARRLHAYQQRFGTPESAQRIDALLAGASLPAKANLINRFFKRADREVTYVAMPNPMAGIDR